MRQTLLRAIFIALFWLLFKYLINAEGNPLLHAFILYFVVEGAIYWMLYKINRDDNVSQPK